MVVVGQTAEDLERAKTDPRWPVRVAAAHTLARETAFEDSYQFQPARFVGLRLPILLLQGTETAAFLQRSTAAVHAALPQSRIVLLKGQGHMGVGTAPDLFVSKVLEFLK